ncbi:MAG: hypothetical protein HUN05_19065 [Desulfobacter sp.]|nr:MAG: hypothetical protein HUN05_19065 [Desulfobacter sp.]
MNRASNVLWLSILASLIFISSAFGMDMSQGLQCPKGWTDNTSARGNDLIKQCIAPRQDAVIELYAAPGQEIPLKQLLDFWTREMTNKGLPFQNFISEQPGQVSGYPAVTRVYSGHTPNGAFFDSSLVASRYKGVSYVFQGLSLKDRQQVRHAMNTWYYPGADQPQSTPDQNTLQTSSAIKVDRHGKGCEAMLKIYDPFGHHIMDFQSTYMGTKPFNNEKIGKGWESTKYRMFYRIITENHSDSEIKFTKVVIDAFKKMAHFCTKPDGTKYPCGKSKRKVKHLDGSETVLRVNEQSTNVLLPGQCETRLPYLKQC